MKTKRILALLLCAALFLSLAACSAKTPDSEDFDPSNISLSVQNNADSGTSGTQPGGELPSAGSSNRSGFSSGTITDADYLMIYNPLIYDDDYAPEYNTLCSTGALGSQIVTNIARADALEEELPPMITPNDLFKTTESTDLEGDAHRAGGLDPVHKVGETFAFSRYDQNLTTRYVSNFTCVYEGRYCYIWSTDNSITAAQAKPLADEFDRNIYEQDTKAFGHGRFTENGGKVNVLFYPMPYGELFCTLGLFSPHDILATGEYLRGINLPNYDHAIIALNSLCLKNQAQDLVRTLAHEFQHQICASDTLIADNARFMHSWLNESMSAYAEELTYPGSKFESGYNSALYGSLLFRNGQSLYHFTHDGDVSLGDYGSVFLFEEYLRRENGDDVFSKIHAYWRQRGDFESSALAAAATDEFYAQVASIVDYPSKISSEFMTKDDEWMSKLTLSFLLETNNMELARLTESADQMHLFSLYDSPYAAKIEGGGRILVATQTGNYQIPSDADGRLVYVALDGNFEPTGFYTKDGPLGAGEAPSHGNGSTPSGSGFPCNGSKKVRVFSLATDSYAAEYLVSGLVNELSGGYSLTSIDSFASHDALISALRDVQRSGDCGIAVVFLNDKSYSASGLSLVIEDLANAGVVTLLVNSQVPANVSPWLMTYNYTGFASSYSELCMYDAVSLDYIGAQLGDFLEEAIRTYTPQAIYHS